MKKNEMIVLTRAVKGRILPAAAAALLTVAMATGAGIVLMSCNLPTGRNAGNGNGSVDGPEHQHKWVESWSGNITYSYYDGSGKNGAGVGPYDDNPEYKPATMTEHGLGYRIGTESGTRTCTDDGTVEPITRQVSYLENIHIEKGEILLPDGNTAKLGENNQEGEKDATLATYTAPTGGINVDTVGSIKYATGRIEICNISDWNAMGAVDYTFEQYGNQAKALQSFFAGSSSDDATLNGQFAALAAAEGTIKTAGNSKTIGERLTTVEAQNNAILDTIFGAAGDKRDEFDKYFNVYAVGSHLASRDWATESDEVYGVPSAPAGAVRAALESLFADLLAEVNTIGYNGTSQYNGRDSYVNIGANFKPGLQGWLEDQMIPKVIAALGIESNDNTKNMARALVIQLGQDYQECRAFFDDITAQGGFEGTLAYQSTPYIQ